MPIQIKKIDSLRSVKQRIDQYETQYNMTSAVLMSDEAVRVTVPEFDAIEWNFLLMQKAAMEEDDKCGSAVFSSNCRSK
jgi:hypothetical protein